MLVVEAVPAAEDAPWTGASGGRNTVAVRRSLTPVDAQDVRAASRGVVYFVQWDLGGTGNYAGR